VDEAQYNRWKRSEILPTEGKKYNLPTEEEGMEFVRDWNLHESNGAE
jgi:hypothetical protein